MRPIHWLGLLLWRGGLLFVGAFVLYETARYLVRFVDLPATLELGFSLLLAGLALVVVSLILERVRDAREEGDLST